MSCERPYCVARVGELVEGEIGADVEFKSAELHSYDEAIRFLRSTYDRFAIEMADRNAAGLYHEKLDLSQVGGFGVRLFNRFGGEVEVGVGRDLWLLLILKPGSCRICGDQPQQKGMLVFYLDGWHHTEMEKSSLISRDEGLRCLREWLNSGIVPNSANNR